MNRLIIVVLCFMPYFLMAQTTWNHYFSTLEVNDAIDYQDKIWVATDNGVYTIDKTSQAIQHFNKENSDLTDDHVETLTTDIAGNLWIGTYDVIVAKVSPGNSWQTFNYPNMSNHEYVVASVVDNAGTVWVGTNSRLLSFNGITWKHYPSIPITSSYIKDIELASNDQLFVLTDSLHTFDINTSTRTAVQEVPINFYASDLYVENDTTQWIVSGFSGVPFYAKIVKIQNKQIYTYDFYQGLPAAPVEDAKFTIHPNTGSLCFASDSSKLVLYDPSTDSWYVDNTLQNQLPVPIKEIANDSNGDLWFFNQDVAIHHTFPFPEIVSFADRKEFNHDAVLAADNNGIVYVTNNDDNNDVSLSRITNGVWDTISVMGGLVTGINAVTFDANNNMWATVYINQTSIAILEQVSNGWVTHNRTSSNNVLPNLFGEDDFDQVTIDQFGVAWVVYGEHQIYKYENGTWSNVYTTFSTAEIIKLQVDPNGDLWWIERFDVLKKYTKSNNTVQTIPTAGVPNLDDFHIDQTTGEILLLNSFPTGFVKKYDNGNLTTVVNFPSSTYRFDVHQGKIYAAYDQLYVYDQATASLTTYDTTGLEEIGSLLVKPTDGSVWMKDEFGQCVIVMNQMILNNNSQPIDAQENEILLYPNPTNQFLNIDAQLVDDGIVKQIQIISATGRIIHTSAPARTLNVDQLPQGVYWLQLQTQDKNYNKVFIKK